MDSEGKAKILSVTLSPDWKRLICGLRFPNGNNGKARIGVWDAQTLEKVLDIHAHSNSVVSLDVSPDSTKLASGGLDKLAFIWSMTTGQQLVGPLQHDGSLIAVRFSPDGERLATASSKEDATPIRIYKNDNAHQLLEIPFAVQGSPLSPFAWSVDGCQLFAVGYGEVKCFDTTSGALLSKWSINNTGYAANMVLACNQKFAVVSAFDSWAVWDTSTHERLGTVIKQESVVRSMALFPNDDRVAIGEASGKITFRSLHNIIPVSYFTANVSNYTWESRRIL